jgi:hypothetical protein
MTLPELSSYCTDKELTAKRRCQSIFPVLKPHRGILLNVVVGIVGAVVAGWVISPLVGWERSIRVTSACRRWWCHS